MSLLARMAYSSCRFHLTFWLADSWIVDGGNQGFLHESDLHDRFQPPWINVEHKGTLYRPYWSIYLVRARLMTPILSSQGLILTNYHISLYLKPMTRSDFLQWLDCGGWGVILVRKYLSYAWSIKAIFVVIFWSYPSLLFSIICSTISCVKFPLPLNYMTLFLSPLAINV